MAGLGGTGNLVLQELVICQWKRSIVLIGCCACTLQWLRSWQSYETYSTRVIGMHPVQGDASAPAVDASVRAKAVRSGVKQAVRAALGRGRHGGGCHGVEGMSTVFHGATSRGSSAAWRTLHCATHPLRGREWASSSLNNGFCAPRLIIEGARRATAPLPASTTALRNSSSL